MTFLPNLKIATHPNVVRPLLAVTIAYLIQAHYTFSHEYWIVLTAFIVTQIADNFPLKQGLSLFIVTAVGLLFATWLKTYTATVPQLITVGLIYLSLNIYLMLNLLVPWRQLALLVFLLLVILFATFMPTPDPDVLKDRLLDSVIGTAIGILCVYIIFPMKPPQAFRSGLVFILNATIDYTDVIIQVIDKQDASLLANNRRKLEYALSNQTEQYPEWVYEIGFNPGLRAGFRYFLIYLDRIIETLFSIDTILYKSIDIPAELASAVQQTLLQNEALLKILRVYFETNTLMQTPLDLTSDITALENSLAAVVPPGIELLDLSPQYVSFTELVRDIKDMRQLLMQLLMSLSPEPKGT